MHLRVSILLLVIYSYCCAISTTSATEYKGYSVYKTTPANLEDLKVLKTLHERRFVKVFNKTLQAGKEAFIVVPVENKYSFDNWLTKHNLNKTIINDDIEEIVTAKRNTRVQTQRFDFKDYHRLDTIYAYFDELFYLYPQNVKVIIGGSSYEGREIRGVYVSFSQNNQKRAVFLEGGIHGREWISPATVVYILTQILTSNDPNVVEIAQKFDWYIFPVFNPDGYEYSHTHDRMWRKTRKPYENCVGVDANRNWDVEWFSRGPNAQDCSPTFSGKKAFSEIETESMAKFLNTIGRDLYAYISFHSFGQTLIVPYGYTFKHVDNYDELETIAEKAIASLYKKHKTEYLFGTLAESASYANGTSIDWIKRKFGTRFVFLYELRDTGNYGFALPPDQIIPTGEETTDSLMTLLKESQDL